MSTKQQVDPELLPLAETFPSIDFTTVDLTVFREKAAELSIPVDLGAFAVKKSEVFVPRADGGSAIRCLLYQPIDRPKRSAAYLQIHGGGYILGRAEDGERRNALIASQLGITVLAVDYRLAPEAPYPAGLEDCYAALMWLYANSDELDIDRERIAVGGDSAGGGMAARLCLLAKEKKEPAICFQLLIYPMLDDRTTAPGAVMDPNLGEFIWTPENNIFGWAALIGDNDPKDVAPARFESLQGLPPTFICVGTLDLFLDENLKYARRLLKDQVPCKLVTYPGAFHGFDLMPNSRMAQRMEQDLVLALQTGLALEPA
ncbi:MAG: alpha/beta hydrolase [Pseudomonadota bacterium]